MTRRTGAAVVLVDRDIEMLREFDAVCRQKQEYHPGRRIWATPLDCGGHDGSDHSYRLAKLVRAGMAESRQRCGGMAGSRGSKEYAMTEDGLARVKAA